MIFPPNAKSYEAMSKMRWPLLFSNLGFVPISLRKFQRIRFKKLSGSLVSNEEERDKKD